MIFETHAHYDDEQFDRDRDELLASMRERGVGCVVNIAADIPSCETCVALSEKYDHVFATVGVHPADIGPIDEESFAHIKTLTEKEKVIAVGEIGLDYYWVKDAKGRYKQRYWYRRQIDLAREKGLPIVIHSRDAAKDTLDISKQEMIGDIGGVVHCFSYSVEIAREYLNMGMYIGVGGVLTYKNARVLKEVVDYAPLDRIVLETDAPYLAPVPNRGKRNSSLNLPHVVEAIAQIKGVSSREVEDICWDNAVKMYKLSDELLSKYGITKN